MKLVFCGTPEFAVGTLEAVIAAGHEVRLVMAQPDRPAGRGMETRVGAVKAAALRHGIEVVQPEKIRKNEELRARLEGIASEAGGLDAILVVAYGRIIPEWMLTLPRFGCINLHGSLLPKYRGAAPIQWAVARGETETGVTTMRLDAGLDTGPMLLAKVVPVAANEMARDLFESLAAVGAELMVETLAGLEAGTVAAVEQNHAAASLAPILTREDGRIDFGLGAKEVYDRWRGFYPWPGAWTMLRGKKLIVHTMSSGEGVGVRGEVLVDGSGMAGSGMMVGCGDGGTIWLEEVQVEGKARMGAAEFLRGYQVKSGERMGE